MAVARLYLHYIFRLLFPRRLGWGGYGVPDDGWMARTAIGKETRFIFLSFSHTRIIC